jgi:hypothetical protein
MEIPILSTIFGAIETVADKIWPDANEREKNASSLKLALLDQALKGEQMLFQDVDSARKMYMEELREKNVWAWVKSVRALARPFIMYSCIALYVWVKVGPMFELPLVEMNANDYALLYGIFGFLFGARSLEKITGKA